MHNREYGWYLLTHCRDDAREEVEQGMYAEEPPDGDIAASVWGMYHQERGHEARALRRFIQRQLMRRSVVLRALELFGYRPSILRGLLLHYEHLRVAEVGSDAHCAALDIECAMAQLPERSREVVLLLARGFGVMEIGGLLRTNSTRRTSRALRELWVLLERER